jgi:hypothetical protein
LVPVVRVVVEQPALNPVQTERLDREMLVVTMSGHPDQVTGSKDTPVVAAAARVAVVLLVQFAI